TGVFTHYNKVSPIKDLEVTLPKIKSTNIDYIDDAFSGKNKPIIDDKYDVDLVEKLGTIEIDIKANNEQMGKDIKVGSQTNKGASGANALEDWLKYMSPEDSQKYWLWNHLRENGLDQTKINDIILTNKGLRPNPNTYLSETYIKNHLKQFDGVVTKIMTQAPTGTAGPPGGTFVMPSSFAEDLIVQAGGDVSKLEIMLSLEPGALGSSPVVVEVKNPKNLRVPSGNELGANSQWLPGGNTRGGIPEASIISPKPGDYIVKPIK
ncbi:hypothetical protein, partial [Anaerorhabdus sp.]|uniref:hypothetical protein n=1 Tax=Anaerorhabdus sp. TaxID=1872524 RepID=UPI002FC8BED6